MNYRYSNKEKYDIIEKYKSSISVASLNKYKTPNQKEYEYYNDKAV